MGAVFGFFICASILLLPSRKPAWLTPVAKVGAVSAPITAIEVPAPSGGQTAEAAKRIPPEQDRACESTRWRGERAGHVHCATGLWYCLGVGCVSLLISATHMADLAPLPCGASVVNRIHSPESERGILSWKPAKAPTSWRPLPGVGIWSLRNELGEPGRTKLLHRTNAHNPHSVPTLRVRNRA
jgi:hypothetical protein